VAIELSEDEKKIVEQAIRERKLVIITGMTRDKAKVKIEPKDKVVVIERRM